MLKCDVASRINTNTIVPNYRKIKFILRLVSINAIPRISNCNISLQGVLGVLVLCLLAVTFAENLEEEKKETVKVPVVPYFNYYYPYAHYYPTSYYKPVSSYSYSYGTYQAPVKYVVPPYAPVHYYT